MTGQHTLMNALVGAAVTVVFAFLPFSSVLGGAVSGYLEGGDLRDGARVGALSGLLATVPLALLGLLIAGFLLVVPPSASPTSLVALALAALVAVGVVVGIYLVGAGALGGLLSVYVADHLGRQNAGGR